jgi:hypothetical protein
VRSARALRFAAVAVIAPLGLALLSGCTRGARSPGEAYAGFAQAVRARDTGALYRALDLDTRWSWMTVLRCQREAYDIVLSNFPEGAEREQHLRRFEAGALSEDDVALFASHFDGARWSELGRGLVERTTISQAGADEASVLTTDGRPLRFRRGQNGRWGFAGRADEAEQHKKRAVADLELVRASAADYERAAARGGR